MGTIAGRCLLDSNTTIEKRFGDKQLIVIGLGTGRSGTASLAKLLNAQRDSVFFHEMNPSAVRFSGTPRPFINSIDEFQAVLDGGDPSMLTVDLSRAAAAGAYDGLCQMREVRLIGDVAFYYLNYVELIAAHNSNVRFICLRRDREQTIRSWLRKTEIQRWSSQRVADRLSSIITRAPYYKGYNFWMEHDGDRWRIDPVWDKCFPKIEANSKREAIGKYWDLYYARAETLADKLGETFWIVDTKLLNDDRFQCDLLEYCGIPPAKQIHTDAHIHRSASDGRASGAIPLVRSAAHALRSLLPYFLGG